MTGPLLYFCHAGVADEVGGGLHPPVCFVLLDQFGQLQSLCRDLESLLPVLRVPRTLGL